MAVGGAAYLVSRAIKGSKVVGFADLGMEAIYEFTVEDMPVTVAVDSEGRTCTSSRRWCGRKRSPRNIFWREFSGVSASGGQGALRPLRRSCTGCAASAS
jgi:hypothetical protein